uniref:alpha-(1,3)-fucosyltransferase 7-like n=1 Tax=Epinephelus lanceolatus TaxID=310571 RepID=UPI001446E868|nr:alpha-(1,3)-fucosyltransferase 7-like [Epinephelus lanceolatus]
MGCNNITKTVLIFMKSRFFLSFLCLLTLGLLVGWPRGFHTLTARYPSTFRKWSSSRRVTILMWHRPFGESSSLQGDVCWDLHRIPNCKLVDQRSLFPFADVVVFHNRELSEGTEKLPLHLPRPRGQRWAWMTMESPAHNGDLYQYANIFNMTITHRRDADISIPYGERLPKKAEGHLPEDVPQNKSFLACWVVSNYRAHHRRTQVYKELSARIPVKVYGQWANTPLDASALLPTISRCYFCLAFENSIAKDYITEKLWRNAYQSGAVPVVLGPPLEDYKAVAPPNSFIHVDEFASVKDLAKYLQQLAEDKKRYSEYFAWKHQWKVKLSIDWRESLCKICLKYNSLPRKKVYSDLQAWNKANNS